MHGVNPRIAVGSHEEHGRVERSLLYMMVGRISIEPLKLFGIVRGAVLGNPQLGDLEVLIAQHVKQRHLADYGPEQVRTLGESSTHQQTAVAAALYGQVVLISVLLRDQVLARGDEIVKDVLLFIYHSAAVPIFTVLGAAAQIGQCVHASVLQPKESAAQENR